MTDSWHEVAKLFTVSRMSKVDYQKINGISKAVQSFYLFKPTWKTQILAKKFKIEEALKG